MLLSANDIFPENGIPYPDTSDSPPLSQHDLRHIVSDLEIGARISPVNADRLLHTNFAKQGLGANAVTGITAFLFVSYVALETAHKMQGDVFSKITTLPKVLMSASKKFITYCPSARYR